MRLLAALPIVALLLVGACDSSKDDAPKPEAKPAEAKPASADAKAEAAPAPEQAKPEPEPKADDYGGELCGTIIPCYQKLEFAGSLAADVTADIEPDGSVSAVSFTGEGPKPVQACIIDAIKALKIDPYNGKPGRVRCKKSGQLMGGTQMLMSEREYEVRDADAAAAKGEAEAKAD